MEMERYYYITLSTCVSEGLGCRWRWAEGLGGAWGSLRTSFGGGGRSARHIESGGNALLNKVMQKAFTANDKEANRGRARKTEGSSRASAAQGGG